MRKHILLALLGMAIAFGVMACSDRDNDIAPAVDGPVIRFAPLEDDVAAFLSTHPPETYEVALDVFAHLGPFSGPGEGAQFARDHSYAEGYRVEFHPEGLLAGVASEGQYYLTTETYRFDTTEGASAVYDRYESTYSGTPNSETIDIERVGDRASAWQIALGNVGSSDVPAVFHRVVFQRGNIIAMVQTFGARDEMVVDVARDVALLVDDRITGDVPAAEPTARPSGLPNAGTD